MSSLNIISNVHYFFTQILKDAHLKENLDEKSLEKAFQWASYCTKVYESCKGKHLETQLDIALQNLFKNDPNWTDEPINIAMVKNSSSLLRIALLQNPYLSNSTYDLVLRAYDQNQLIQDCCSLSKTKLSGQIHQFLINGLNQEKSGN